MRSVDQNLVVGILLVVCALFSVEEAVHLAFSHPWTDKPGSQTSFEGCTVISQHVSRCQSRGYGSVLVLCYQDMCYAKEPVTGLRVSRDEEAMWHISDKAADTHKALNKEPTR